MRKILSSIFQASFIACCSLITHSPVTAQPITTDGTLAQPTEVTPTDAGVEINGGTAQGNNLFHSFNDFSVPTGTEAYFNNNVDVVNILNRVTGGNISNIDGLIRANGGASLFLINPAGIVFGSDASLEIGGSFFGTTADSLLFEQGGEFSAVNPEVEPILTINAPIGLNFRDNPQPISNQSTANDVGLNVSPGNNITLVGGELNFNGGILTAPGGRIELGGLSTAGEIGISEDGSLSFAEGIAKADITLSNAALVNASNVGDGNIILNAGNLDLTGSSFLRTGIIAESTSSNSQAGDIDIDLADKLTLNQSGITNQVNPDAVGNAGNINITAGSIGATNGGEIDASTNGQGNAGSVNITAGSDITFEGENSQGFGSGATSQVNPGSEGNAGDITVSSGGNLTLRNGGRVDVSTNGQGDAGSVNITAGSDITFERENSQGFGSGVTSQVNPGAEGNAGDVAIFTLGNLTLTDRGRVDASTFDRGNAGSVNITVAGDVTIDGEKNSQGFSSGATSLVGEGVEGNAGGIIVSTGGNLTLINEGRVDAGNDGQGDAGDITILTEGNLTLIDGGQINANANGQGNAGSVNVTAGGDITFEGKDSNGFGSGVTSLIGEGLEGDSGDVTISTLGNLNLRNGGRVDVGTSGQGDAGSVNITAGGDITFEGENLQEDSQSLGSGVTSQVNPGAEGNSGGVTISTLGNLNLRNGGRVDASTNGEGNAGSVNVTAGGDITFEGEDSNGFGSGVTSLVNPEAEGNSGGVIVSTLGNLNLRNGGRVDASANNGEGNAGSVEIEANSIDLVNEAEINAQNQSATVDGGNINLKVAEDITLDKNSQISAQAQNNANGGNLTIDARFIIAFPGNSDIVASAEQGQGGEIDINVQSLLGIEERPLNDLTNDINASSDVEGLGGTINITTSDINIIQGWAGLPTNVVVPEETTEQACESHGEVAGKNGFTINTKGGIPADPGLPLNSFNVSIDGEINPTSAVAQPIKTSQGEIQPARGIEITESGKVILTAYPTDNSGDKPGGMAAQRLLEIKRNCV